LFAWPATEYGPGQELRTNYAKTFEITIMYPILPVESAVAVEAIAAFFTVVTSLFSWFFLARV
jgi:hypothetical protein